MYHTGSFVKGASLIYNLDPRLKLAAITGLSIFILWVKPPVVLIIGVVLFFVALASGVSLRTIGQAVKPLLVFIILIFSAHIFFNENKGDSLMRISFIGLSFSIAGMQQGFFVVWRFLCLIVAAVLLTMTTAPSQMTAAIKFFLKPLNKLRVPVDEIAVMMMLALRLMPLLLMEKEKVETAQTARGYNVRRAGLIARMKAFLSLTVTVLLGVFRRADELALAMEARNYQRGSRTSFVELRFVPADYLVAVLLFFSLVILVALNSHLS